MLVLVKTVSTLPLKVEIVEPVSLLSSICQVPTTKEKRKKERKENITFCLCVLEIRLTVVIHLPAIFLLNYYLQFFQGFHLDKDFSSFLFGFFPGPVVL